MDPNYQLFLQQISQLIQARLNEIAGPINNTANMVLRANSEIDALLQYLPANASLEVFFPS